MIITSLERKKMCLFIYGGKAVDGFEALVDKLSPQIGDLLLIRYAQPAPREAIEKLCEARNDYFKSHPSDFSVIILERDVYVEQLSEPEMNRLGWYHRVGKD